MMKNPTGICKCGCGELTNPVRDNDASKGHIKGDYYEYKRNHRKRKHKPNCKVKRCSACKKLLWKSFNFFRSQREFDGYRSQCIECCYDSRDRWKENNPDYFVNWAINNPDLVKTNRHNQHVMRQIRIAEQFVEEINPMHVFERDEGICGICNLPVDINEFQVDHIIPLSKGGEHSYKNVQASHADCNRKKGPKMPAQIKTGLK